MRGSERISSAALFDVTIAGKEWRRRAHGASSHFACERNRVKMDAERNSLPYRKLRFPPVQTCISHCLFFFFLNVLALQLLVVNKLRGCNVLTRGHSVCHQGSSSIPQVSATQPTGRKMAGDLLQKKKSEVKVLLRSNPVDRKNFRYLFCRIAIQLLQ